LQTILELYFGGVAPAYWITDKALARIINPVYASAGNMLALDVAIPSHPCLYLICIPAPEVIKTAVAE
jgi:hypothetical protein